MFKFLVGAAVSPTLVKRRPTALIALAIGALAWPGVVSAATFIQTSDDCSSDKPCGIDSGNKIDVTADGNNTRITLTFANSDWKLVNTGANSSGGSFNFGFTSSVTGLIFTAETPSQWTTATGGLQVQSGTGTLPGATETANSAAISAPSKFSFTNGFAINCNTSGASNACGALSFDISMSLADVLAALATSGGSAFYLDAISGQVGANFGNTGIIDFSLQTSTTPLPPAALLFGSALVGMGVLGRRRRKHVAQA